MAKVKKAQCPLILRCHRLMDAFSKSDDERDFYLDQVEGYLVYADLNKTAEELDALEAALDERFLAIPKLTFYETKKIMEGFVNEKVYDIDVKEKLLDIIGSKDPRENFLEFLYDNLVELEKWQQFYQERSRIRIIEWLRSHEIKFVFEEDLELPVPAVDKCKSTMFQAKVSRDVAQTRKILSNKAETYYSSEALNPRPKRGRPPKHVAKVEVELQYANDAYQTVLPAVRPFLFIPDITSLSDVTFSAKHESEEAFKASLESSREGGISELDELAKKLAALRNLSKQVEGLRKK